MVQPCSQPGAAVPLPPVTRPMLLRLNTAARADIRVCVLQAQILYALCEWRVHECPVVRDVIKTTVGARRGSSCTSQQAAVLGHACRAWHAVGSLTSYRVVAKGGAGAPEWVLSWLGRAVRAGRGGGRARQCCAAGAGG